MVVAGKKENTMQFPPSHRYATAFVALQENYQRCLDLVKEATKND